MPTPRTHRAPEVSFDEACAIVETALDGSFRRSVVDSLCDAPTVDQALTRLRDAMRSDAWTADGRRIDLKPFVEPYDAQTRREGFHALHDWDGTRVAVNREMIPVDVLNYVIDQQGRQPVDRTVPAILLDYYFVYILGLLSLRVWDSGDANANLERLQGLLDHLQGADGSGQRFASDVETLILIATSHYEPNEAGYESLLDQVRTLNRTHQAKLALVHAASMGCHLRFGFEATYGRDTVLMREDNVADYPWVCYAVAGVMREYARVRDEQATSRERDRVVEALANGLSPDVTAFVGRHPPTSLSRTDAERREIVDRFEAHRADLVEAFERHRPSERSYSPLAFFFNFAQNVLKGIVIDSLVWGEARRVSLNDLLTGLPRDDPQAADKEKLATTLMGYARANPDQIRGRLMPAIVYDPQAGRRAFGAMMRALRQPDA